MSGVPAGALRLDHHHDHDHHDHHGDDHRREANTDGTSEADPDELRMTTVGIDVGSSTSHLMFADLTLRRLATSLSSRYVVTDRRVRWRSSVMLTPYTADGTIDAVTLSDFVEASYGEASVDRSEVDSGAVILTGEALRRRNARAIADALASTAGNLVCASAGHHLEAVLAAHGSGAVALSRSHGPLLNVDIGGGTSKLALTRDGAVVGTAALAVGGRLVAYDADRRIVRLESTLDPVLAECGLTLRIGDRLDEADERRLAQALVDALTAAIQGRWDHHLASCLLLTDPLDGLAGDTPVSFSGGVAEYLSGHQAASFGDLAPGLASELGRWLEQRPTPVVAAGQRIRATVIGASQFSVQVSGNTVGVDEGCLPLRNLPVVPVEVPPDPAPDAVAAALTSGLRRLDEGTEGGQHAAVAVRWVGDPSFGRLHAVAAGLIRGWGAAARDYHPLVVVVDTDVAASLARTIRQIDGSPTRVTVIDGIELGEFDYVDVGRLVRPAGVVPVVVRSLLFPSDC